MEDWRVDMFAYNTPSSEYPNPKKQSMKSNLFSTEIKRVRQNIAGFSPCMKFCSKKVAVMYMLA